MDTNVWLLVFSSRFPLATLVQEAVPQGRIGVPRGVLGELDRLCNQGIVSASAARRLAERFPVVEHVGRGDAGILRAARELHALVVTGDRDLARRLREQGTTVLVPRDRVRLERLSPRKLPAPRARKRAP